MKKIITAALFAAALIGPVRAETLDFPSDAPVATVTFPDAWKAEETETGIQASSPDEAIAFYIDVTDMASREQAVRDSFDFLKENGVEVDPATDDNSQGTLNGMDSAFHNLDGKDANGPVTIGIYLLKASEKTVLVATYWGTKGEQDKYGKDMMAIMNSLKPAAN